jgi:hypothetical protein
VHLSPSVLASLNEQVPPVLHLLDTHEVLTSRVVCSRCQLTFTSIAALINIFVNRLLLQSADVLAIEASYATRLVESKVFGSIGVPGPNLTFPFIEHEFGLLLVKTRSRNDS